MKPCYHNCIGFSPTLAGVYIIRLEIRMDSFSFALAAGVFFGNWLALPLVLKRSYKDSFTIGVIAAILVLCFYVVFV